MNPSTEVRILYPVPKGITMFKLIPIPNPRTKEGGWEDEDLGCDLCGSLVSAYVGLEIELVDDFVITIKMCKGCLDDGQKIINKELLDMCTKEN